jgi:hypothetical protein
MESSAESLPRFLLGAWDERVKVLGLALGQPGERAVELTGCSLIVLCRARSRHGRGET